jgi:hypothetical protein
LRLADLVGDIADPAMRSPDPEWETMPIAAW